MCVTGTNVFLIVAKPVQMQNPLQVRDDLKRFLESMMAKSGKLRSLIRELRKGYSKDVAAMTLLSFNKVKYLSDIRFVGFAAYKPLYSLIYDSWIAEHSHQIYQSTLVRLRCLPALEAAIKEVDQSYDSCNEAWAQGEADKFRSAKLHT